MKQKLPLKRDQYTLTVSATENQIKALVSWLRLRQMPITKMPKKESQDGPLDV